jgi:mevalonate kinase
MSVKASAPGKIIIAGEHAVVYGEPAIIAAVDLRTHAEAEKSSTIRIEDPQMGHNLEWSVKETIEFYHQLKKLWEKGASKSPADFSELFALSKEANFKKVAMGTALFRLGVNDGIMLKITGDIPPGSGLGSSSALSLVMAKSVAEVYGKKLSLERLNEIAYEIEQFAAGLPSGADNSTCCFGGLVWFQKDMKTGKPQIISMKNEIPYKLKNFILVYTGRPEKTTGELVQQVRMHEQKPRDQKIRRIGMIVREMKSALIKKDFQTVKNLINENWDILRSFGLSTPAADRLIERVRKVGGAAKLCGGGGGGIALCYHEDITALKKAIKSAGFEAMEVELGVEGVRIE